MQNVAAKTIKNQLGIKSLERTKGPDFYSWSSLDI